VDRQERNQASPPQRAAGYAAALSSAFLSGLFTVLNKWLLQRGVPPLTAAAWTYLAAGAVLSPWAIRSGGLHLRRPWFLLGWLLAGSVVGPLLYFFGLQRTSGVQGVLLSNLQSVFTALLAFTLFRERLTPPALCAGFAVIAGAVWVSWPGAADKWLADGTLGNLLVALGYLSFATEDNLGRSLGSDIPPVTLVCLKALAAAGVTALLAAMLSQRLAVSWDMVPVVLASGAGALGLALALFYFAMQRIGAGRGGLIATTSALWGVGAAAIVLHEPLGIKAVGGGLLMFLGVVACAWEAARKRRKVR
jgi:drug/metabolite transporter (DMT)-like permease